MTKTSGSLGRPCLYLEGCKRAPWAFSLPTGKLRRVESHDLSGPKENFLQLVIYVVKGEKEGLVSWSDWLKEWVLTCLLWGEDKAKLKWVSFEKVTL